MLDLSDSGASIAICKDTLLIPALLWDPPGTWARYQWSSLQLSGGAQCKQELTGRPLQACVHANQPLHWCCREVPSYLVVPPAAACNHCSGKASACVLRGGDARRGAGWGQRLLASPPSQDADEGPGETHPALKHCWLLPLQGLDHLLSPAEGGEAGEDLTGSAPDSKEVREKDKTAFPSPHSATKVAQMILSRSQNRALLCQPAGCRGLVEMVFIQQRLWQRLSGLAVCLCASCR